MTLPLMWLLLDAGLMVPVLILPFGFAFGGPSVFALAFGGPSDFALAFGGPSDFALVLWGVIRC